MFKKHVTVINSAEVVFDSEKDDDAREYIRLTKQLADVTNRLYAKAEKDPIAVYAQQQSMSKLNKKIAQKYPHELVAVRFEGNIIAPLAKSDSAIFIDSTVLNTLLHGKLLKDEQKLELLYERGYIKRPEEGEK